MPLLFAVTMFVSATLLFMVQPMVGKMILPTLGGSPAAWNTCMVFFQGLLLAGYLYAHKLTEWNLDRPGRQVRIHLAMLVVTVVWLAVMAVVSSDGRPIPVFESIAPQGQAYPMFGVLLLLGVAVGLPFLFVSTSAPLLQRWFVYTGHPAARDPYFLYAASNAGSLLTLVGYPLVIEPLLTVKTQTWLWASGFLVLTGLVYLCGRAATDPLGDAAKVGERAAAARRTAVRTPAPPLSTRLRWVALAFVPSSLMLGVTFHMTTDIASVPLLWVIPLALYLLTFIIAFARTPGWFLPVMANVAPVMILLLVFVMGSGIGADNAFLKLVLHLAVYFATALLMHTELARLRPAPDHLTAYFLLISVGGVLGGIFNALVAPVAFPLAWEYPIALAVACLLVPPLFTAVPAAGAVEPAAVGPVRRVYNAMPAWMFDVMVPLAMLALAGLLIVLPFKSEGFTAAVAWVAETLTTGLRNCGLEVIVSAGTVTTLVVYALPCMACFLFIDRPVRFGLCVAAVLFAANYRDVVTDPAVDRARSFFGSMKVTEAGDGFPDLDKYRKQYPPADIPDVWPSLVVQGTTPEGEPTLDLFHQTVRYRSLYHGTTLHGKQAIDRSFSEPITDPGRRGFLARQSQQAWLSEAVLRDDLRLIGAATAWDAVLLAGAKTGWDFRQEPLTYYHRTGPVGEIFAEFRHTHPTGDVGMIGLGTGTVAAYARPGQSLTFYEIDPTVLRIVETPRVLNPAAVAAGQPADLGPFTFIADARKRGADVKFVLGDARLKLQEDAAARYDLLLVDAFSSDAIPIHLLTREAMALYESRIADDGLLAIHISNRFINLRPVVARLADEAGLAGRIFNDNDDDYPGKTASSWIVLAKSEAALGDLGAITADTGFGGLAGSAAWVTFRPWDQLFVDKNVPAWTDDYSDVLRVMTIDEIRAIRKYLGLPVAGETE